MFIFAFMQLRLRARIALLAFMMSPLLLFTTTLHADQNADASWSPDERTLLRSPHFAASHLSHRTRRTAIRMTVRRRALASACSSTRG